MINTRKITCRIIDITKKADKNDNNYLILEVDNDSDIFVFASKINQESWKDLKIGQTYNLILEEEKGGLNILKLEREDKHNFYY